MPHFVAEGSSFGGPYVRYSACGAEDEEAQYFHSSLPRSRHDATVQDFVQGGRISCAAQEGGDGGALRDCARFCEMGGGGGRGEEKGRRAGWAEGALEPFLTKPFSDGWPKSANQLRSSQDISGTARSTSAQKPPWPLSHLPCVRAQHNPQPATGLLCFDFVHTKSW